MLGVENHSGSGVAGRWRTVAAGTLAESFPGSRTARTGGAACRAGQLAADYAGRGLELIEVASGFRVQVPAAFSPWVSRLWEERAATYSRALLETLALVAYRQPVTRGEIEEVRGVSVSSSIMKTLQERDWIKVVGHREVPGRPALYATTRAFLDYFNLKSLSELPPLAVPRDLDTIGAELDRRIAVPSSDATTSTESPDD
jgi:segregation and condensation protein B